MDITAVVISLVALAARAWAAWGTHRQAVASERSAAAAEKAASDAAESLELARAVEERERDRQYAEGRPTITLERRTARRNRIPGTVELWLANEGPTECESVVVKPDLDDEQTARLVRGFASSAGELSPETVLDHTPVGQGWSIGVIRNNPQDGETVKFHIEARRGTSHWHNVVYVNFPAPPRASRVY